MKINPKRKARALFVLIAVAGFLSLPGKGWADHPSVGFSEDGEGLIQTISADTLPKGTWGASVSVEYQKFDRFSDDELKNFAEQGRAVDSVDYLLSASLTLGYGFTDDLALSARIPYVTRSNIREGEIEGAEAEAHHHGGSSGVGDLILMGKWRMLKDPVEISPILGVKLPTGDTDEKDKSGRRLETDHQPGSGSWDGLFGLALTKHAGSWTWSASGLYQLATEGSQETNLGDRVTLGMGASYRLIGAKTCQPDSLAACDHKGRPCQQPSESSGCSKNSFASDLVLEGIWEHQQAHVIGGVKDPESGGDILWIAPGLRLKFKDWSWSTSVGVPVSQDLNGSQHEPEVKVLSVLSTSF